MSSPLDDSEPAKALMKSCSDRVLDGAFLVAHFADAMCLYCEERGWGDEEARRLAMALEHATAQGALKELRSLELHRNEIGDEGMRHLSDAFARGAVPTLQSVVLGGNPASEEAQQAVQDTLKK